MLEREAWLWPLPPAGILELHAASEPYGVPEGTVQIDGAELRKAAAGAFDVAAR